MHFCSEEIVVLMMVIDRSVEHLMMYVKACATVVIESVRKVFT